jgi:hypothetical protein
LATASRAAQAKVRVTETPFGKNVRLEIVRRDGSTAQLAVKTNEQTIVTHVLQNCSKLFRIKAAFHKEMSQTLCRQSRRINKESEKKIMIKTTAISKRVGIFVMALILALCTAVSVSASETGYEGVVTLPDWAVGAPPHTFNIVDNDEGISFTEDDEDGIYTYEVPILAPISVTVYGPPKTGTVVGATAYDANAGYDVSFDDDVVTITTANPYYDVDVDITFSVIWSDDLEHVNTTTANLTIIAD